MGKKASGGSDKRIALSGADQQRLLSVINTHTGTVTATTDPRKFRRAFEALQGHGFDGGQIERALIATGGADVPRALDWLCLNLPNHELPRGFATSILPDPTANNTATGGVRVRRRCEAKRRSAATDDVPPVLPPPPRVSSKTSADTDDDDGGGGVDKSWILRFVEAAEEEEEDEEERERLESARREAERLRVSRLPPAERLRELRVDFEKHKALIQVNRGTWSRGERGEANRRMGELATQIRSLEITISNGDEPKSEEEESAAAAAAAAAAGDERTSDTAPDDDDGGLFGGLLDGDDEDDGDGDGDDGVGFFGNLMMEEPESDEVVVVATTAADAAATTEETASLPEEAVVPAAQPRKETKAVHKKGGKRQPSAIGGATAWTGKTPKVLLMEWCQKNRLPRPKFESLSGGANLSSVTIGGNAGKKTKKKRGRAAAAPTAITTRVVTLPTTWPDGTQPRFDSQQAGEQAVATRALYEFNKGLPLYRLLPPEFRDMWVGWLNAVAVAEQQEEEAVKAAKDERVRSIMQEVASQRETKPGSSRGEEAGPGAGRPSPLPPPPRPNATEVESPEAATARSVALRTRFEKTRAQLGKNRSALAAAWREARAVRENLPAAGIRQELLQKLRNERVLIVAGETGSGKTTQVPQFILEDAIENDKSASTFIVVTQPRRIAAVSVAERVACELGTGAPGAPGSLCGYHIRMRAAVTADTRLLFCTTGILLRRLCDDADLVGRGVNAQDGWGQRVTHVCIDEVHERDVQSDFLLVIVRELLSRRPDLKIILMSATMDADLFSRYFDSRTATGVATLTVPGRTYPVAEYFLEDLLETTGHVIEDGGEYARREGRSKGGRQRVQVRVSGKGGTSRTQNLMWDSADVVGSAERLRRDKDTLALEENYSRSTVWSLQHVDETVINYDLILDVLLKLCEDDGEGFPAPPEGGERAAAVAEESGDCWENFSEEEEESKAPAPSQKKPCGGILIFLPGIGEIRCLHDMLNASRKFGDSDRFWVLALHSSISPQEQKQAFVVPPAGVRKIVIATNIAETSVTIPDVTCVIDSGLVKQIEHSQARAQSQRDAVGGIRSRGSSLVVTWTSKASTRQRAGRAGRTAPGICCRLFSSKTHRSAMPAQQIPEIQRVPLTELCLQIKLMEEAKTGTQRLSCRDFLALAPQPPSPTAVTEALTTLFEVGALTLRTAQPYAEAAAAAADSTLAPSRAAKQEAVSCDSWEDLDEGKVDEEEEVGFQDEQDDGESKWAAAAAMTGADALDGGLTNLGRHLARLPVDVHVGKMLLYGALFRCLDPILTIAAGIGLRSPFVSPMERRQEADAAKKAFAKQPKKKERPVESDFILIVRAFDAWEEARKQGGSAERRFCQRNFLSRATLHEMAQMKGNWLQLLQGIGFVGRGTAAASAANVNSACDRVVSAVILAGLYPNVARADTLPGRTSAFQFSDSGERVYLHPSSVNCDRKFFSTPWLVFHEKVTTSRVYVRDTTVVTPFSLLLFGGGDLAVQHSEGLVTMDGGWIVIPSAAKTGVIFIRLRAELDALLASEFSSPGSLLQRGKDAAADSQGGVIQVIVDLLRGEEVKGVGNAAEGGR